MINQFGIDDEENLQQPTQAPVNPTPLPGMPPTVKPDQLKSFLNNTRASMNKYGPEDQMALQEQINKRRNSFGYRAADAGKGFADAIMMGVARAGNPGWQNQFENQQNQLDKDQMETLRNANQGNLNRTESNLKLDAFDPNSPISQQAQQDALEQYTQLGGNPENLKKMSKANIENMLSLMTQFGGKKLDVAAEQARLKAEDLRLKAALSKQASDEDIANRRLNADVEKNQEQMKQNAIESYTKLPWYKKFSDEAAALRKSGGLDTEEKIPSAIPANNHPDAGEALIWAQNNPNDPRAQKILKRLGK